MRLRTSWYNHELTKQNFRQTGWISLVYFVSLLVAIVLNIFMRIGHNESYYYGYDINLFYLGSFFQVLAIFLVPVMTAMLLMRYLHQKNATDFMHSLPLKREKVFIHQIVFGYCSILLPVYIVGFILYIMHHTLEVSKLYGLAELGYWLGVTTVLLSLVFAVSIFVGLLTGLSIIQGVFSFIFLLFPAGITVLAVFNLNYAMIGIADSYLMDEKVFEFSPITNSVNIIFNDAADTSTLVWYIIVTLILLGLSMVLYKFRPVEVATQAVAFRWLRPIFIYSFTFCFMLVGGFYFGILQHEYNWILFGCLLFSIFGYLIAQMIIHKTWRVFTQWKEYLFFLLGTTLLVVLIILDITGFQNRIPATDRIEQVYLYDQHSRFYLFQDLFEENPGITAVEEIEIVRNLHQQFINDSNRQDFLDYNNQTVSIHYDLVNGRQLVRQYHLDDLSKYTGELTKIHASDAYKQYTQEVFLIDQTDISSMSVTSDMRHKEVQIYSSNQIAEALEALRKDILAQSYEELVNPELYVGEVNIFISLYHSNIYLPIYSTYDYFLEWLEKEKMTEDVLLMPNEIDRMFIVDESINEEMAEKGASYYVEHNPNAEGVIEISDEEENFQWHWVKKDFLPSFVFDEI